MQKQLLPFYHHLIIIIFTFFTLQIAAEPLKEQLFTEQKDQQILPLKNICSGSPWANIVWIHVHDDEETAREVALQTLSHLQQGCLLDLQHGGSRDIYVQNADISYHFDPNRIFTQQGRQEAIKCDDGDCRLAMPELTQAVEQLISQYLQYAQLIVAVHNNHAHGLSILHYANGSAGANDTLQTAINPQHNPHNFFLVTSRQAYEFLSKRGFNVILQDNDQVQDDGSLSVWAAHKKIDYINIEAERGHNAIQVNMLHAVWAYMQTYYLK